VRVCVFVCVCPCSGICRCPSARRSPRCFQLSIGLGCSVCSMGAGQLPAPSRTLYWGVWYPFVVSLVCMHLLSGRVLHLRFGSGSHPKGSIGVAYKERAEFYASDFSVQRNERYAFIDIYHLSRVFYSCRVFPSAAPRARHVLFRGRMGSLVVGTEEGWHLGLAFRYLGWGFPGACAGGRREGGGVFLWFCCVFCGVGARWLAISGTPACLLSLAVGV